MTMTHVRSFCQRLRMAAIAATLVFGTGRSTALSQQMSVANSPHNLSTSGPGTIRAASEEQICIFCHTPHHASAVRPLWNRQMSIGAYTPYQSNSLKASPGQPTGSSKLCLSCHDGTIALGNVLSRPGGITMTGGVTLLPKGASNLGTDLSDDHPISFPYDQVLIQKNPKLRSPAGLPGSVKLDQNQELQCVSCHNPHDNQYGKFLVMNNTASQLCNACHNQGSTAVTNHTNCSSCHQPHSAPSGPYLLAGKNVPATCTTGTCHGVQASQPRLNIASELARTSKHDTNSQVNLANQVPDHVTCEDCHESHTMGNSGSSVAPAISPRLGRIDGMNSQGSKVRQAQYEYEVCFKCHADQATALVTVMQRKIVQTNKRLQLSASAASFHPVEIMGRNSNVPSLISPLNTASLIYCTDCHASDDSAKAGGVGPNGPHGSNNNRLLIARYVTTDKTAESSAVYALCYRCHDRNNILSDASFPEHHLHIVNQNTPCSACHDSHGIAIGQGNTTNNAHLINFDTSIVQPEPFTKRLEYVTTGNRSGSCFLSCHNVVHFGLSYSAGAARSPIPLRTLPPAPRQRK